MSDSKARKADYYIHLIKSDPELLEKFLQWGHQSISSFASDASWDSLPFEMKVKVAEYLHPKEMMKLALTARSNYAPSMESAHNYFKRLGKGEMANQLLAHHKKNETRSKAKQKEHGILEKLKPEFAKEWEFLHAEKYDLDNCVNFLKNGGSPDLTIPRYGNIVASIMTHVIDLYEDHIRGELEGKTKDDIIKLLRWIPGWVTRRNANAEGVWLYETQSCILEKTVYMLSKALTENDKEIAQLVNVIIDKLLDAGADVNKRNQDNETPIFHNISRTVLDKFIARGLNMGVKNKQKQTPLEFLFRFEEFIYSKNEANQVDCERIIRYVDYYLSRGGAKFEKLERMDFRAVNEEENIERLKAVFRKYSQKPRPRKQR